MRVSAVAYSEEIKRKVRNAFVKGMPLKGAAAVSDIPYETARNWKRKASKAGDDWDLSRTALRLSASGIETLTSAVIEDFVHMFQTTLEELKDAVNVQPIVKAQAIAQLSDAYQKTIKAAGSSSPKLSALSVAMDVLQKLAEFVRIHFPQHLNAFMEILEPFGEELSQHYG